MKLYVASHQLDTCSWKVLRKSIQGKWQKCCVVYLRKNNASATHFLTLSPKLIARFCWKRARLSLFRPQPHPPSFIQIRPSVRELLAKTTFQVVTIIGEPIGNRIADKGDGTHTPNIIDHINCILDCTTLTFVRQ